MGLLTKVLLFFIALVALGLGAWIIALPIFAYLFLPPILRAKGGYKTRERVAENLPSRRNGLPSTRVVGAVLLLLSLIAIAAGGTFAPFVFGVPGLLLLAATGFVSSVSSRARPVEDSVLLRGRFFPLKWFAIAEAKFSTRDPARALSGLQERIIVCGSAPRFFVVFPAVALGRARAEGAIFGRMRVAARTLSPLGVYLLPLDAKEAAEVSSLPSRTTPPKGNLSQYLASADCGAVLLEARNGAVDAYSFHGSSGKGGSALERPKLRPASTTFLGEIIEAAIGRNGLPRPDEYTVFLSSMAATVGETFGQRITESVQGQEGQVLLVASLGTPKVRLSRAQFRAVTFAYE
jgi:hypothetical protein